MTKPASAAQRAAEFIVGLGYRDLPIVEELLREDRQRKAMERLILKRLPMSSLARTGEAMTLPSAVVEEIEVVINGELKP